MRNRRSRRFSPRAPQIQLNFATIGAKNEANDHEIAVDSGERIFIVVVGVDQAHGRPAGHLDRFHNFAISMFLTAAPFSPVTAN